MTSQLLKYNQYTLQKLDIPEMHITTVLLHAKILNIWGGRLAARAGKYHQWIQTSTYVAGLGNSEGIPGEGLRRYPDMPGSKSFVVNHEGLKPELTWKVIGVDIECVNTYLCSGTAVRRWIPLIDDCNTFCKWIFERATPKPRWSQKTEADWTESDIELYVHSNSGIVPHVYNFSPVVMERSGCIRSPQTLST